MTEEDNRIFVLVYVQNEEDKELVERETELIREKLDILYLENKLVDSIIIASKDKRYSGEDGLREFVKDMEDELLYNKNINMS